MQHVSGLQQHSARCTPNKSVGQPPHLPAGLQGWQPHRHTLKPNQGRTSSASKSGRRASWPAAARRRSSSCCTRS